MIRAAIYARFSSDQQNDRSIDDQIALCRQVCLRESMEVVSTFEDRAISGSSVINRPGFQALMRAAEALAFDVVVAEDVDRIARDQGDWHAARKRLDFLGIAVHTATGKVGKLDGALRALMGEMFIENLALHTRRGMEGVIREGRHAGGRAYGYVPVPGKPGELQIVHAEAEIIRQIFADYLHGVPPRTIARKLNERGVRPARGVRWSASSINGNVGRGGGILLNDLYVGRIVWNKVRMIKDPLSGKRVSRPNPKDQYRVSAAPHLRIVDDETFTSVQALKSSRGKVAAPKSRVPKRVFSGLLRCGSCGGGMSSNGSDRKGLRIQCSTYKESGSCVNGRRVYLDEVEALVLNGLCRELDQPVFLSEYVRTYNEERRRLAGEVGRDRAKLERRLVEIEREIERLVDSVAKGMPADAIGPRVQKLQQEKSANLEAIEAAARADTVVQLYPQALSGYRRILADLAADLRRGEPQDNFEVFGALRRLVTAIIVHAAPSTPGGDASKAADTRKMTIDVQGRLAALCENPATNSKGSMSGGLVVAGEGLEPPTPGL